MEYEKNLVIDDKFRATMSVTVTKETVKSEYHKMLAKYAKEIAIPGFRRGKVPQSVLEAKFIESIKGELLGNIIEEASKEIFEALPPEESPMYCSKPSVKDEVKLDLNSNLVFELTYDVAPKAEIKKWEGFEVKIPNVCITDEDVEREIKALQERNALIQAKGADGVVENGDVVTVDYDCVGENSQPVRRNEYVFTIGSGVNSYNFDDDILGMKKGEKKEIVKTYPNDYQDVNLRGTTKTITVTIRDIKQKILPKLDDDFAQDVNEEYNTLEDLKGDVRKKMENMLDAAIYQRKKDLILEKLVEANPVFIPESMILHESANYYSNLASQYGMSQDVLFKNMAGNENEYIENLRPIMTRRLQAAVITMTLQQELKIESTDEEMQEYIKKYADAHSVSVDEVNKMMETPKYKEDISYNVVEEKIFKQLFDKSVFEKGDELSWKEFLGKKD